MKKAGKQLVHSTDIAHIDLKFPGSDKILSSMKKQVVPGQTYLLAVSGGADSMLTATLVYKYFLQQKWGLQKLILVHCNHKVRTESDQEAKFLTQFFKGANFHVVTRMGKMSKINEENLRKRRYEQFAKLAKKYKATTLILGHNLNDRIESTFLNMLRGSHVKWFLAMQEYEKHHIFPGYIYRPLLHLGKKNILKICSTFGIPFVVDQSNLDSSTSLRNKLRNKVLPSLYALGHKETSLLESFENIYAELENKQAEQLFTIRNITRCSLWQAKCAYEIIPHHKISTDMTAQVLHSLGLGTNIQSSHINDLTKFFSTAEQWYKYFKWVYFFLAHQHIYAIQAPLNFRAKAVEKAKKIDTLGQVKRYNFTLPITHKERIGSSLRFAKASDRYHHKTRNQYCITAKIPVFRRNFVPVLVKGGKIVNMRKEMI